LEPQPVTENADALQETGQLPGRRGTDSELAGGNGMKNATREENHRTHNWLGELPDLWVTKRLKYVSTINDDTLPETTDPDYEMLYVDIGSVDATEGIQKKEPIIFETSPSRARRIVQDGDTIVSTVRTYLRAVAPIRNPEENLIVSTGFAVVRPKGIDPHYLAYSLRSSYFIETVVSRSVGVSYPATNPTDVSCIDLPLPPVDEQQTIARFLDVKTAQIDALVAQKRQLIDKLKKKRSALITLTVTRGLSPEAAKAAGLKPNHEMKNSEVEWIGYIPDGWRVVPFKRRARFVEGPGIMAVDFMDEGVPLIRISGLADRYASLEGANHLDPDLVSVRWAHFKTKLGDLLISGSASTGLCCEVDASTVGCIPYTGIIIIRAIQKRSCNDFLRWYFQSDQFLAQVFLLKTGSTIQHFGPSHLARMTIALPSNIDEQHAIAEYLDRETAEIDSMTATVEAAIERLVEYRQAVITSAITGKIDLRELT
jgi:type I restriction enzyme S subunit